jgi:hypothetical protein
MATGEQPRSFGNWIGFGGLGLALGGAIVAGAVRFGSMEERLNSLSGNIVVVSTANAAEAKKVEEIKNAVSEIKKDVAVQGVVMDQIREAQKNAEEESKKRSGSINSKLDTLIRVIGPGMETE